MWRRKSRPTPAGPSRVAARIALIYAAFGTAYILFSDVAVEALVRDAGHITHIQSLKGFIFILVTALLVFQMVRAFAATTEASRRELQRSEQGYRRIVETSNEGIAVLDVAGRLALVNGRLAEWLGYAPEELHGRSFVDFVDESSRQYLTEQLESRVSCPQRGWDVRLRGRKGNDVWAIAAISPLADGDRPLGSLLMLTDISDRRRLQAQLIQLQKMDALGQLAGGVAHDFNNIITAILGNADLLRLHLSRKPASLEAAGGDIEQIERAGERAVGLTRQLLTFSRRQAVKLEMVNIGQLLSDMGKMLGRLIQEDIVLAITSDPQLPAVEADAGQIEQVVVNLVVNARDAMPNGGRLSIDASSVTLDADYVSTHPEAQAGEHILLTVSDTGVGIDAETIQHIFEPFFTTKPAGKGTGLGLATAYGIVKQFHGHIGVYSERGIGTAFKIYLPAARPSAALPMPQKPAARTAGRNETVLVCEDEPSIRNLIQKILTQSGYQVMAVEDPEQALDLVRQHSGPIHLVITDVVMAGLDGRQLAARITADHPGTKVLYISGYTPDIIAHHGVLDPGVELLEKPFTADALVRRVGQVLNT